MSLGRAGSARGCRRRDEGGGAYLLALVSLVLLTGLGLAVSRLAQTERLLGGGEAALADALAGAESGLELAAVATALTGTAEPLELLMGHRQRLGAEAGIRVTASAPLPAQLFPCGLCELNPADATSIYRADYLVEASGERLVWAAGEPPSEGRRRAVRALDGSFALQPWIVDELPHSGTHPSP